MKKTIFLFTAFVFIFCSCNQTTEDNNGETFSLGHYLNTGYSKLLVGDYRGAISDFNKAIEINPNNAAAYDNRGSAKAKLEDYRGAISDFSRAIEIDPNDANAYLLRGIVNLEINQKESACRDFSKAGELGISEAYEVIKNNCN